MTKPRKKIDPESWNAAIDAAAALLARGFMFVRRPYDPKTTSYPVEIKPGRPKVTGDYVECCHVTPDDEGKDVAAVLSLKRKGRKR